MRGNLYLIFESLTQKGPTELGSSHIEHDTISYYSCSFTEARLVNREDVSDLLLGSIGRAVLARILDPKYAIRDKQE